MGGRHVISGAITEADPFWLGRQPMTVRVRDAEGTVWLEWDVDEAPEPGRYIVSGSPRTVRG